MLVVLDSTVLIDYLRGRPAVDRVRAVRTRGDVAATTAINVEEILIAAAALHEHGVLCTGNPRDLPIPELLVEHWPVGE